MFKSYTDKATGMEVTQLCNGAWQDEDGVAHVKHGIKRAQNGVTVNAPKKAKSMINAAFKKTATFKRINAALKHDDALSAAILRFNEEDRYTEVMALTDAEIAELAAATAAHRAINTNDKSWHTMKDAIIARFGFRI